MHHRAFLVIASGIARFLQGFPRLRRGVQVFEAASGLLLTGIGASVQLGRYM